MTSKCKSCEWARRNQCQARYQEFEGDCYFEPSKWRPAKICRSGRVKRDVSSRGGA